MCCSHLADKETKARRDPVTPIMHLSQNWDLFRVTLHTYILLPILKPTPSFPNSPARWRLGCTGGEVEDLFLQKLQDVTVVHASVCYPCSRQPVAGPPSPPLPAPCPRCSCCFSEPDSPRSSSLNLRRSRPMGGKRARNQVQDRSETSQRVLEEQA